MSTTEAPERKASPQTVTERDAREVTEAAREKEWVKPSFVRELFLGNLRMDLIHPIPEPDPGARERGEKFMADMKEFLEREVDGLQIEKDGKIPEHVMQGLRERKAFAMKIPQEYGGLELSQVMYGRAVAMISTYSSAIGVLLSAHQSIGVPQPLKMFGTPEQKQKYLPRFAEGQISAFALTEPDVGSDPARMEATADPTPDGEAYILNGEKLWCTNAPIADVMVVMARTPAKEGRKRRPITAFIVENDWEGVTNEHRLEFMGLRGIENGLITFKDVRVPKENLLWGEGKGLKLALTTLNTGRLTIPATCAAAGKWCTRVAREFAAERVQWGAPVGKHDAVAQMLGEIASHSFAMDAVAEVASALADAENYDIRLEAAMAKMWNSETAWRVGDLTMQIRGGRGYETADSLKKRGEAPVPVEQMLRDLRINMIFEGSSEIMRLFIAREAVDPHLQKAGRFIEPDASIGEKAKDMVGLGTHMAGWFAGNVAGWSRWPSHGEFGALSGHIGFAERRARKLARTLAYAMSRYGARLEKKQAVLFRMVEIGAELFAMGATCAYAVKQTGQDGAGSGPMKMADLFCRHARRRIDERFERVFDNDDDATYRLAQEVLKGQHAWLEQGVAEPPTPDLG
ncbi:MAG: acyl-CoA dehydrogenase [Gemmatimonadetes bacterium]|nr:acyl-CoA dehydrogenase [Gemmatimonadota bacterium]NIQ53013.1 acyl-CoA dehydrogenase [Gemmatimonadota bacterium]NIU73157.1 acyl-CoA dehydrogenase [Gammaproteobacteria bacterium]NIX43451.1 acyl-CoA dehydrogenase [Gemmatimonadota bacterium]NIY07627.1 acyl-CoA dehydrogenase [Gemmatimonadota bacterium]